MNINNIFGGLLGLILSIVLMFGFWTPITAFLSFLPTELQIFCGVATVIIFTFVGLIIPINLFASDDKGEG